MIVQARQEAVTWWRDRKASLRLQIRDLMTDVSLESHRNASESESDGESRCNDRVLNMMTYCKELKQ